MIVSSQNREWANVPLAIVLQSSHIMRLQNPLINIVLEASSLVSTKTLLLKHSYRRQGKISAQNCRRFFTLVGACLATGDRIFATGSDSVSKIVLRSCVVFAWFQAYSHDLKGPQKPKHIAIIAALRSYLSALFLLLGRDPCRDRGDLAILSPEGPRNSSWQLRFCPLPRHLLQNSLRNF